MENQIQTISPINKTHILIADSMIERIQMMLSQKTEVKKYSVSEDYFNQESLELRVDDKVSITLNICTRS